MGGTRDNESVTGPRMVLRACCVEVPNVSEWVFQFADSAIWLVFDWLKDFCSCFDRSSYESVHIFHLNMDGDRCSSQCLRTFVVCGELVSDHNPRPLDFELCMTNPSLPRDTLGDFFRPKGFGIEFERLNCVMDCESRDGTIPRYGC